MEFGVEKDLGFRFQTSPFTADETDQGRVFGPTSRTKPVC